MNHVRVHTASAQYSRLAFGQLQRICLKRPDNEPERSRGYPVPPIRPSDGFPWRPSAAMLALSAKLRERERRRNNQCREAGEAAAVATKKCSVGPNRSADEP